VALQDRRCELEARGTLAACKMGVKPALTNQEQRPCEMITIIHNHKDSNDSNLCQQLNSLVNRRKNFCQTCGLARNAQRPFQSPERRQMGSLAAGNISNLPHICLKSRNDELPTESAKTRRVRNGIQG